MATEKVNYKGKATMEAGYFYAPRNQALKFMLMVGDVVKDITEEPRPICLYEITDMNEGLDSVIIRSLDTGSMFRTDITYLELPTPDEVVKWRMNTKKF